MDELEKLRMENEELKKANAVKSEWISISAHQIRTSLSAIRWILKMFLDKDFGEITAEQEGFIKKASASSDRMIALVNEMLSLDHVKDVSLKYELSEHHIIPLIESVLFDFTGESFKKGIEVIFLRPENELPPIFFDKEKIRVVMQNLIENAIKYSNSGGKVIISARQTDDMVEVSVKDTGIGIPQSAQDKVFQKFFRAQNAEEKDSIGSGIGLYTVKSIVEHHGGTMRFESAENQGTTFFFSLPANPPSAH